MAEAQYARNHTIDPETGFLESRAHLDAFDAPKKKVFIERLKANGLSLYDTCDELSMSHHTVNKHYQLDTVFREEYDKAEKEYADRLDGVSKRNALNPKSVIERIFQLKSLRPEKYADQKSQQSPNIVINIDPQVLSRAMERQNAIEAELVREGLTGPENATNAA